MLQGKLMLGVIFLFGVFSLAQADDNSAGGGGIVAVLDLQRAIMMTDAAKEKIKTLESEKEYATIQKEAEALRQDLIDLQQDLEKNGPTWSLEKRNSRLQDMEFKRKDFDLAAQKLQTQNQAVIRGLMQEMEPKVKDVLQQLIEDENLSIVIDKTASIYASRSVDITVQLTERLNKAK